MTSQDAYLVSMVQFILVRGADLSAQTSSRKHDRAHGDLSHSSHTCFARTASYSEDYRASSLISSQDVRSHKYGFSQTQSSRGGLLGQGMAIAIYMWRP